MPKRQQIYFSNSSKYINNLNTLTLCNVYLSAIIYFFVCVMVTVHKSLFYRGHLTLGCSPIGFNHLARELYHYSIGQLGQCPLTQYFSRCGPATDQQSKRTGNVTQNKLATYFIKIKVNYKTIAMRIK